MEDPGKPVNELFLNAPDYFNLKVKSLRLSLYERLTDAISQGISAIFLMLLIAFTLLFASLALGFWLSKTLSSYTAGFGIIAIIYLAGTGLLVLIQRNSDQKRLKNKILLKVSKNLHDYDALIKTRHQLQEELEMKELKLKKNFSDLKEQYESLRDQLDKMRSGLTGKDPGDAGDAIPRLLVRSVIDLVLDKYFIKNAGLLTRKIVPVIANSFRTSKTFRDKKQAGLFKNLRLKISKFLL
jgi:hypothetical protein